VGQKRVSSSCGPPKNKKKLLTMQFDGLRAEEKASLDQLIPLIVDDGPLHETTSLPSFVYESPRHLDYVCQRIDRQIAKSARLASIDRLVRIKCLPIARICRFRGYGGPHAKMMWSLEQRDSDVRLSSANVKWASTGDEAKIKRQFYKLIDQAAHEAVGVERWRGCNDDRHYGRFYPVPKTQVELDSALRAFRLALEAQGFRVEILVAE